MAIMRGYVSFEIEEGKWDDLWEIIKTVCKKVEKTKGVKEVLSMGTQ